VGNDEFAYKSIYLKEYMEEKENKSLNYDLPIFKKYKI
jgi:hypothetical protein